MSDTRIVDIRLVRTREGVCRISIDGRAEERLFFRPSHALIELGEAIYVGSEDDEWTSLGERECRSI